MRLPDKYADLAPLIKGSSYQQLFDLLYKAGQLRYSLKSHLNKINPKIGTPKKLKALVDLNYFACNNSQVFTITEKTVEALKEQKYNCKILARDLTAGEAKHELEISSVILEEMDNPNFYAVCYPSFTNLIPDALIVYKKPDAYRLLFCEIENEKWQWQDYLNKKRRAYQELARKEEIHKVWWKRWSKILELPYCSIDDFKFSYRVVKNG